MPSRLVHDGDCVGIVREDFIISRGNDPEARLVAMDERWPRSKR